MKRRDTQWSPKSVYVILDLATSLPASQCCDKVEVTLLISHPRGSVCVCCCISSLLLLSLILVFILSLCLSLCLSLVPLSTCVCGCVDMCVCVSVCVCVCGPVFPLSYSHSLLSSFLFSFSVSLSLSLSHPPIYSCVVCMCVDLSLSLTLTLSHPRSYSLSSFSLIFLVSRFHLHPGLHKLGHQSTFSHHLAIKFKNEDLIITPYSYYFSFLASLPTSPPPSSF